MRPAVNHIGVFLQNNCIAVPCAVLSAVQLPHTQGEKLAGGDEYGMTVYDGAAAQGQLEMRPIATEQDPIGTIGEIQEMTDAVTRERRRSAAFRDGLMPAERTVGFISGRPSSPPERWSCRRGRTTYRATFHET